MKLLNWMQSKINGRQTNKRSSTKIGSSIRYSAAEAQKEEFSDWPHCLLAIGTFGNNQLECDEEQSKSPQSPHPSPHYLADFSPEEVGKLQKELAQLLNLKPTAASGGGEKAANLPLDSFLNCLPDKPCECLDDKSYDPTRSTSVATSKRKDNVHLADNGSKNNISQRSVSFLLKKMFVCHGGFYHARSLRDPSPDHRMEKILRAILHKKIYPQSSSASSATKKYLGNRQIPKTNADEDQQNHERANDGSKWVKTDSEFIVLEI